MSESPFGLADCESEITILKDEYSQLYFEDSPFNGPALDPDTYLIVGRRGAGKTALAKYFSFQQVIKPKMVIDIDQPTAYQDVLSEIARNSSNSQVLATSRLVKVWEYLIWRLVGDHIAGQIPRDASSGSRVSGHVSRIISDLIEILSEGEKVFVEDRLGSLMSDQEAIKANAFMTARATPIFIVIDTLEKYEIRNENLMNAIAALVQCASEFNLKYSRNNIHIKAFVSGEALPYLTEVALLNPHKSVKHPLHLVWTRTDLLRLICWRFHRFITTNKLRRLRIQRVDWEDPDDVWSKIWVRFFPEEVVNLRGVKECSFDYLLRHTQMRPRQLIVLCNSIATQAIHGTTFPSFTVQNIQRGVRDAEHLLAVEILNSYSTIYPNLNRILDSLIGIPMKFKGKELNARAVRTRAEWPTESYSDFNFRHLVSELGIVGRVRDETLEVIRTDFGYCSDSLSIVDDDDCAIHPMFYKRFNVSISSTAHVLPSFNDHWVLGAGAEAGSA